MTTYHEKLAQDIEAGDRILCRDGGIRAAFCTYKRAETINVIFVASAKDTAAQFAPQDVVAVV